MVDNESSWDRANGYVKSMQAHCNKTLALAREALAVEMQELMEQNAQLQESLQELSDRHARFVEEVHAKVCAERDALQAQMEALSIQAPAGVYLVATGEVHEGQETYTRHDVPVPLAEFEVLYCAAAPAVRATPGIVLPRKMDEDLYYLVGEAMGAQSPEQCGRADALWDKLVARADADTEADAARQQPRAPQNATVNWPELCHRLYGELLDCDQLMMQAQDEEGGPMWIQGTGVRDVLADAKAALIALKAKKHDSQASADEPQGLGAHHWIVPDFGFLFPSEDAAQQYLDNLERPERPIACYVVRSPEAQTREQGLTASSQTGGKTGYTSHLVQACSIAVDSAIRRIEAGNAVDALEPLQHAAGLLAGEQLPATPPQ